MCLPLPSRSVLTEPASIFVFHDAAAENFSPVAWVVVGFREEVTSSPMRLLGVSCQQSRAQDPKIDMSLPDTYVDQHNYLNPLREHDMTSSWG
jgi:hypothetical protein